MLGLFSRGFDLFDILMIVIVIAVIVACIKWPKIAGKLLGSLCLIVFVYFSVSCGMELGYYYTAQGGIHGYLKHFDTNNQVESTISDSFEYKFKNIVMTQQVDGSYSAKIYSTDLAELADSAYMVFVNNEPCSSVEYSAGTTSSYVKAGYVYSFKNDNLEEVCIDTLTFNFAFFKNTTELKVSTNGGQTAVDYWNTYFARNNFIVKVEPTDTAINPDIEWGEGDFSNYSTLTYMVDDEVYMTQIFDNTKAVTLVDGPLKAGYVFNHWLDIEGNVVNDISRFSGDVTLIANYTLEVIYLDYEIENGDVKSYTGSDNQMIIPSTYSLYEGKVIQGNDYTVTKISMVQAVLYCDKVSYIEIPETVTEISPSFFAGCFYLKEIVIKCQLEEIDILNMFRGSNLLKKIILNFDKVPTLKNGDFLAIDSDCLSEYAMFYVPNILLDVYKNADGWSEYLSGRILPISN